MTTPQVNRLVGPVELVSAGSVLRLIGALQRATPGPSADAAQVAGWYRRKAALLARIAVEDDLPAVRVAARQARAHAAALSGAVDLGRGAGR